MPRDGRFYFERGSSPHNHHSQLVDSLLRHPSSPPSWWWTATAADCSLAVRTPGIAHHHRPQSSLGTGCADGVARLGDAPHPQAGGQQERGGGEEESAHGVQVGLGFFSLVRPLMSSRAWQHKNSVHFDVSGVKRATLSSSFVPKQSNGGQHIRPLLKGCHQGSITMYISLWSWFSVHRVIHPSLIQTPLVQHDTSSLSRPLQTTQSLTMDPIDQNSRYMYLFISPTQLAPVYHLSFKVSRLGFND